MNEIEIKIEKGIAIPDKKAGKTKYPFDKMEVGDSFYLEIPKDKENRYFQAQVASLAGNFSRKNGGRIRFSVRKINEGIRVWRIK